MTVTVQASGTQTAVIGTEHTLSAQAGALVHTLSVNTSAMVAGDELELRAYTKVLTGDSQSYLLYYADYIGLQGDGAAVGSSAAGEVVKVSPPVSSAYSLTFTLKQVAGTGRAFPWRVDSY